ncbi:MAG: acyl-CoA dehydrogenase family protein [Chloroflexota bacterium]
MDFDFSPEQTMLRDVTREIMTRESPATAVRALLDDPAGYNPAVWKQLAETGLLGVTIDEQRGGQGLGMVELALVLEEMGRAALPSPYFATVVLAASAIQAGGNRAQMDAYLPAIAGGTLLATLAVSDVDPNAGAAGITTRARLQGGDYVLSGTKHFVPFAHLANLILVAARTRESGDPQDGITLFAVERGALGLGVEAVTGMDQTSRDATVTLADVRVGRDAIVGTVDDGWKIVSQVLERAAVAASAEMLGAARKCMDMSVEYVKVREQFGQPIGAFQAIKHACAEMLLEVEGSHGAVYYAAWAQDADAPDASMAASVAKSWVNDAARKVCGSAIQVHGGIGFTWEYDLHLYFKRAKRLEALYGDSETHCELVLEQVLSPREQLALA